MYNETTAMGMVDAVASAVALRLRWKAGGWDAGGDRGGKFRVLYEDIQAAVDVVEKKFKRDFSGCTMTALRYAPHSGKEGNEAWAEQYDAEEAMVLYSDFDVDSSGGDGSLNPNSTYTDWSWVLVRENGGAWKIATWGMG